MDTEKTEIMEYQRNQSNPSKYYKYAGRPKGKCEHNEGGKERCLKRIKCKMYQDQLHRPKEVLIN